MAMIFPAGIASWTLKEGVAVLFPSDKNEKALHEWPDYWRLKVHFDVGITNSILFTIPCFIVWIMSALNTLVGALVFVGFVGALSVNALIYFTVGIHLIRPYLLLVYGHTSFTVYHVDNLYITYTI